MLLSQQIQAILYHILSGWIYAFFFSFIQCITHKINIRIIRGIIEIIYHIIFILSMYYGLFHITYGQSSIYLFLFFIFAVYIYYKYYMYIFMPYFQYISALLLLPAKQLKVVKRKIFGIMSIRNTQRKKRKADGSRKKKKEKRRSATKFISLVMISVSCFLFYKGFEVIKTTFDLKSEIAESQKQINQLQEEEESLSSKKSKLQDNEYIRRYARSKYSLSKDGEQIFILPNDNE